jgi:hypothetical protein
MWRQGVVRNLHSTKRERTTAMKTADHRAVRKAGRRKQRAVELDADNRRAWSNLATTYRRLGEGGKADSAEARVNARPAPSPAAQPAAAASAQGAAAATAVTVSPVNMDMPAAQRMPALAASAPPAPAAEGAARAGADAASPLAPLPAGAAEAGRGAMVVKLADNIFQLRNGQAQASDRERGAAPVAAAAVTPPATIAAPPGGSTGPGGIAGAPATRVAADARTRYEISNGHGGTGLARRLAALLGREGGARPRLTNQRPFDQPASFIAYRDGYREAAESFAAGLPFRATIRPEASAALSADVRLVLGRDLDTSDACGVLGLCRRVARADPAALAAGPAPLHAG